MRGLVRPLSFFLVSVPLLVLWQAWLRDAYTSFVAAVFAVTVRLSGREIDVLSVRGGDIRFETADTGWIDSFGLTGVNVVAFVALAWATAGVSRSRRLRMVAIGVGLLFVTHVLGLWTDIVHAAWHMRAPALANGLRGFMTGFGTFFFPLALWLWMVRDRLPLSVRRSDDRAPAARS